jgi:RND family efflux transporter MFP subunit
MKKKLIFPVLAVLGIIFMINYVNSVNVETPKQIPVAEPSIIPFKKYIGAAGITEPNTENISVGTNKAGIVKEINFKIGDKVKKDDVLFVIENSEAKAQVSQSAAELQNAQDQYNIIAAIKDKRAISKDRVNQARNNLNLAKAKLQQAEANLELHNVRAPVEGTILSANIRKGEFAQTGLLQEPLVRMGNLQPMHIRVDIDENDAWRFKDTAKAIAFVRGNNEIKVDLNFVRLEPYVRPKKSLTGESLERVDTRVLQVIYSFAEENNSIFTGQQMDVYISDE